MSSSNALREAKKREKAQEQIDANLASTVEMVEVNGKETAYTPLRPMDSYSTKFMTPEDQVVLAVDKVDAPEVKAGMMPQLAENAGYLDNLTEVFDYATHLSLNDGDAGAFSSLRHKMSAHGLRKYSFIELDESTHGVTQDDFVLSYMRKVGEAGIAFVFDLYDGGVLSDNSDVPSISASIELSKEKAGHDIKLRWEYVIAVHSSENKKPKDADIKSEYLKMQAFMRAIIVTMGILPTNL